MTGRFITIEGGEGAGKSTAQAFLAEMLREVWSKAARDAENIERQRHQAAGEKIGH